MTTEAIVQFNPENFSQLEVLCRAICNSGLLPVHLRGKPADLAVTVMTGRELGLTPMQSIRGMYVVGGKAGLYADQMVGLCVSKPVCKYFRLVESDGSHATYETLREGHPEPTRITFTMADAERAGLTSNANYKKHPPAMLRARAASALARAVYPDLLAGVYDPSELIADHEEKDVTPAAPKVVKGKIEEPPAGFVQRRATDSASAPVPDVGTPVAAAATIEVVPEPAVEPPHDPQTGEVQEAAARVEEQVNGNGDRAKQVHIWLESAIEVCKRGWDSWDAKRAWYDAVQKQVAVLKAEFPEQYALLREAFKAAKPYGLKRPAANQEESK